MRRRTVLGQTPPSTCAVSRIVNAKRGGNTSGLPFLLAISAATGFALRWSRFLMSLSIDSSRRVKEGRKLIHRWSPQFRG